MQVNKYAALGKAYTVFLSVRTPAQIEAAIRFGNLALRLFERHDEHYAHAATVLAQGRQCAQRRAGLSV